MIYEDYFHRFEMLHPGICVSAKLVLNNYIYLFVEFKRIQALIQFDSTLVIMFLLLLRSRKAG